MSSEKLFEYQHIARSNYLWHENKTRINLVLSAVLLAGLMGTFLYL